jgi:hypothetical protein
MYEHRREHGHVDMNIDIYMDMDILYRTFTA